MASCVDPTEVVVRFTADPMSIDRAEALRIVVHDTQGGIASDQRFEFGDELAPLDERPAAITLVPDGRDASRRYRVVAELVGASDTVFSRREVVGGYVDGERRELWVHFDDACADVLDCAAGTTCDLGVCAESCATPSIPGATTRSELVPCPDCYGRPAGAACDVAGVAGRCWGATCCTGCWDGTRCAPGSDVSACGSAGVECSACECEGDACTAVGCMPAEQASFVSTGASHTCATGGSVFCWGNNDDGQLGTGDRVARLTPARLSLGDASAQAGDRHTCAITSSGQFLCWGYGEDGAFPDAVESRLSPPPPSGEAGFDLGLWTVGLTHGCAIRRGELACWGNNSNGAVGLPMTMPGLIVPPAPVPGTGFTWVSAKRFQTCGIRDESLYCWGFNMDWQLGLPDGGPGALVFEPTAVPTSLRFRVVSTGWFGTCAIDVDGHLHCFGALAAEIPLPSAEPWELRELPLDGWEEVTVGSLHGCGLRAGGQLYCFGQNNLGQLGTPLATSEQNAPVPVGPTGWQWQVVSAQNEHTCAVRQDFTVWCWGEDDSGQLGRGTTGGVAPEPTRVCLP